MSAQPIAERALVVGFGITGAAVAASLLRRGADVVAVEDHPTPATRARADSVGVSLVEAPGAAAWATLVADRDAVVPSPGVADGHPVLAAAAAAAVSVLSELDLAQAWDDRPLVAVTGTNGKTTVTTLVTAMLRAAGRHAVDAGNTEVPLVAALEDPDVEVFVVEASSFRLGRCQRFAPAVATWLNFAPDHLDVHASLASYEEAKARIWATLPEGAVAVANRDDPVVARHVPSGHRVVTFGLDGARRADHWTVRDGALWTPDGEALARVDELRRGLPHDVANALAAAATATAAGVPLDAAREALRGFEGLAHRVQLVAEADGVCWYDDSKSTTPHATLAAVQGFASVVLLAGGRNKGLDLAPLRSAADQLRAVVAIGEAAPEVAEAFAGAVPVHPAASMHEAVALAASLAARGDAVLLSPGCASFDWYSSYGERGDDFAAQVLGLVGSGAAR